MNAQTRREIRFGLTALALSWLLMALGIALRGQVNPTDPEALIRATTSPTYVPGWTIFLVGSMLHLYGVFGLYRYLTYQTESLIAFLAFVLRIAAVALTLPLFTFFIVNLPLIADLYEKGNQQMLAVVETNFTGLGIVLFAVSGAAEIPGWLLFAVAMWRDGRLPRWAVVLFVVGLPLLLLAPIFLASEFLGAVLLLISAGAIAWKGWQETATGSTVAMTGGQLGQS